MKRNYYKPEVLFQYSFKLDNYMDSFMLEDGYYFYDDLQNNIFRKLNLNVIHGKLTRLYAKNLL